MIEKPKTIISHIRQTDMVIQSNEEHQRGVAQRAETFAAEFSMGDCGRVMDTCNVLKQYPQIAPFIAQTIARHLRTLYVTNYK